LRFPNYFLLNKTLTPKYQNDGFLALANSVRLSASGGGVACATSKNFNYHELSQLLNEVRTFFERNPE